MDDLVLLIITSLGILLLVCVLIPPSKNETEGLTLDSPIDYRYWPYYLYTQPDAKNKGGTMPPNLQTRFSNDYPGFNTTGLGYTMRPGVSVKRWNTGRYVRDNQSKNFINNGTLYDRKNDYGHYDLSQV
jgi:hypothetical protein